MLDLHEIRKGWRWKLAAARQGEPEAIHEMRLAIRRLRTLWELAGLRGPRRMRKLGKALGAVRDWDIHQELLLQLRPEDPQQTGACRDLLTWVAERRARELKRFRKSVEHGVGPPNSLPPLPDIPSAAPLLERLSRHPTDEATLHRLRIDLKHLRYALEWRDPSDARIGALRELQRILGLHRDWFLLEALIHRRRLKWQDRGEVERAGAAGALARQAAQQSSAALDALSGSAAMLAPWPSDPSPGSAPSTPSSSSSPPSSPAS